MQKRRGTARAGKFGGAQRDRGRGRKRQPRRPLEVVSEENAAEAWCRVRYSTSASARAPGRVVKLRRAYRKHTCANASADAK